MTDTDDTKRMPVGEPVPPAGNSARESGPRRLLRSRSDRMLAGVSGGLGDYFGVDPVIFRIGFAVTLFFGGFGLIAYLALAIFVPSEPKQPGEADPPAMTLGRVLGGIALVIAGLIALGALAVFAFYAAATGHGWAIAVAVIAIGAALVIASFRGGARWLVLPALALALPLGSVAAADIAFDGGVGEREYRPTTAGSIPEEGYELGVGQLKLDLRNLPWHEQSVFRVKADQGVGQMVIAVPGDVCVSGGLDADAGAVEFAGDETDGLDTDTQPNAGASVTPRLELDAHVDLGHLVLVNDDDAELDAHEGRYGDTFDRAELRERMAAACAPETTEDKEKK